MVSCGIWRPVYLLEWNHAKIEDFQVYQKALSEEQAALEAHITIDQDNQHDFVPQNTRPGIPASVSRKKSS
jgi:hypothetical protein